MSTIKITALPSLSTPDTNKANTIFVVVDKSSGVPTTKQMSLANLEFAVDDTGVLAFAKANGAYIQANAGFDQANTANTLANIAYFLANTGNSTATVGLALATTANNTANAGYILANTANTTATAGLALANTANNTATASLSLANTANNSVTSLTAVVTSAFNQANTANATAIAAYNQGNTSYLHANSAYNLANTLTITANVALTMNVWATSNTASNTANAAYIVANTANARAANSVAKTGDTMSGDLTITANLSVNGKANVTGQLTVGSTGFIALPNAIAQFTGDSPVYIQMNTQNKNKAGAADIVITADNGDDGNNYIDIGLAGSEYADSAYSAYLPNDGWVVVDGKPGQTFGGNLMLGASGSNGDVFIIQGGHTVDKETARFVHNQGLVLKYNTTSTSNSTGALVVQGGIGANGNIFADAIYASGVNLVTRLNSVYTLANSTSNTTNTAYITASFNTANTANTHAHGAFDAANTALSQASIALLNITHAGDVANVANSTANYANTVSNTAYILANTLNVTIVSVSTTANTGNITANAAFAKANLAWTYADTVNTVAQTANTTAITANIQSNIATVNADASFAKANLAWTYADTVNTNVVVINTTLANTVITSNNAYNTANDAYVKANAAFDVANTALALGGLAVTLESSANLSLIRANAAFDQANAANSMVFSAYASGNTNATNISTLTTTVGTIWTQANTSANSIVTTNANVAYASNLANSISNVATQQTNTYFVDPNRTDAYTELGTILYPFKTIAGANNAAVTSGHNDSNPAYIVLMGNVTENVAFNNGGIFLTGAFSSGTHSGINLTGQITCNGSSASISDNHFSISNLRIIAPSNAYGILARGANPQRVFMRDLWIDAAGSGACVRANGNNSSVIHLNTAHLAHSNTGDVYGVQVANGVVTMTDIETSGSITVASVSPGANLVLTGSEIDANNAAAIEVYGGTVTVGTSILTNANTTGHGIALKTAGSVALVQNVLFNVQSGTNARAVFGVTGSACYYQYLSFYPGSNSKMSSNVSNTALTTTFTFTAP